MLGPRGIRGLGYGLYGCWAAVGVLAQFRSGADPGLPARVRDAMLVSLFGWLVLQVAGAARIDLADGVISVYYPFVVRHVDVADVAGVEVYGAGNLLITTKDGHRLRQPLFQRTPRPRRARKAILDFLTAEHTSPGPPARRWQPRPLWPFLAGAILLQLTAAFAAR
ncbi:hypothetical protein GA0115240_1352141 [Streptomyces sp. DvalAA-14]|nr:hypothetical protein GA0115240_1352141 [Streptomyces sp. DvalAA-14]